MKQNLVVIASAFVLFSACNSGKDVENKAGETDTVTVVKESVAAPAAGVAGTYSGTTPCPDCERTEITLSLNADGTFKNVARNIRKDKEDVITTEGKWTQKGDQIELMNNKNDEEVVGDPMLYKITGDNLTHVDQWGKADEKHVLKKGQ